MQVDINIAGVLTVSLTTIFSFIIWLLKRKRDFKKLYNGVKKKVGDKASDEIVKVDKKTFKLKYGFYQKLVKLLVRSIKEKYLKKVFTDGEVDYEKIVKEILDFIGDEPKDNKPKSNVVT